MAQTFIDEEDWSSALHIVEPIVEQDPPYLRALHIFGQLLLAIQ